MKTKTSGLWVWVWAWSLRDSSTAAVLDCMVNTAASCRWTAASEKTDDITVTCFRERRLMEGHLHRLGKGGAGGESVCAEGAGVAPTPVVDDVALP